MGHMGQIPLKTNQPGPCCYRADVVLDVLGTNQSCQYKKNFDPNFVSMLVPKAGYLSITFINNQF